MFKRIILGGWVLWLATGFVVVMFPGAGWNRAASWLLWLLTIPLVPSTVVFGVLMAFRFVSRLSKPKSFKWILLGAWLVLFVGALLVVGFPSAAWRQALVSVLWVLSIILFLATIVLCARIVFRLISSRPTSVLEVSETRRPASSESTRSRTPALVLLAILGTGTLVGAILTFIEHEIKSSSVYQTSVAKACSSPEVVEIVGQPVQEGWFASGTLSESSDGRGIARLNIPLSGPKGKGVVSVEAGRVAGTWRFSTLRFRSGTAPYIDLLSEAHQN